MTFDLATNVYVMTAGSWCIIDDRGYPDSMREWDGVGNLGTLLRRFRQM
jgi:hypothetical protein